MKLALDFTQRLNLYALIGQQRGSLNDIRLFWKLQDKIDLTAEEKKEINWRTMQMDGTGQEQVVWDLVANEPREFNFTSEENDRLEKALNEWQPGFIAAERRWLEPLLAQLEHNKREPVKASDNTEPQMK
jgi:hypothetical protein